MEETRASVEDQERVARGLVRLAQSHRQLCADFLRDHRDGMDTPAVAKFAARIHMFDRVIASASFLSNLPDDNNDRHAMRQPAASSRRRCEPLQRRALPHSPLSNLTAAAREHLV